MDTARRPARDGKPHRHEPVSGAMQRAPESGVEHQEIPDRPHYTCVHGLLIAGPEFNWADNVNFRKRPEMICETAVG